MLEGLEEIGFKVLHEFPNISKGGISVRIAALPKGKFTKCSYLRQAPTLEVEFFAYKILHQIE